MPAPDPFLARCRRLWAAAAVGIVALAAIVTLVAPIDATLPAALPAALAAAVGGAAIAGVLAIERLFAATPPATDQAARSEYRMRLLLQAVLAEVAVIFGVVLAVVFGPSWVAGIGGLVAGVALLLARPTEARFRRLEAAWRDAGQDVRLTTRASAPPAPNPRPPHDHRPPA